MTEFLRPVWAEVDLGALRAQRRRAVRDRRAGPGARGGEGRRLRPRRGRDRTGRGRSRRGHARRGPRRRRRRAARRRHRRADPGALRTGRRRGHHRRRRRGSRPPSTPRPASRRWPRRSSSATRPRFRCTSRSTRACTGSAPLPRPPTRSPISVAAHRELQLEGLWTHLAVADEPDNPYTGEQLRTVRRSARRPGRSRPPARHRARREHRGSAGVPRRAVRPRASRHRHLRHPARARARVGRAVAAGARREGEGLVREATPAGAAISYGLRYRVDRPANIATVPIGYGDGVPRNLSERGRRGARARPSPPDRGHGHDGPADGRPRRRHRRGR